MRAPRLFSKRLSEERVRVHDGAQPERLCLAAGRLELGVRHRLCAAFANALRCKNLNQIRTLLLAFPNQLAQFLGPTASFRERFERRQHSRRA